MQNARYPEVPPDFGHWLAGFIDGEGCFFIRPNKTSWHVRFRIALRADDRPILEEIQRRTGLGLIRDISPKLTKGGLDAKPQAEWYLVRKSDLVRLVVLLDQFPLRAKKRRDYEIWREACLYWASLRHLGARQADWGPLPKLFEQIKAVRVYVGPSVLVERGPTPAGLF